MKFTENLPEGYCIEVLGERLFPEALLRGYGDHGTDAWSMIGAKHGYKTERGARQAIE